ncbi:MAG TPA: prolyl oligopeptidase family serine peptidase [Vicinamibacterales bacterium]|nr:prolyl oligopeptidase family serine peptidase [Vicinamibacterales bacterium]
MRLRRISTLVAAVAVLWTAFPAAQQPQPLDRLVDRFVLDPATVNIGDVSADGKWIVATTASLRGRIGIDNSRFGDPTYTAPSLVDVSVIDTGTGATQKLFTDKRQMRGFKWSPDGSRLAFLVLDNGVFAPMVWEGSIGTAKAVALPAGKEAADNAELDWSKDGAEVLLAVRGTGWRADAKNRFDAETDAPVIVHSSTEPFLAWDQLRRMSAIRSVVACDITRGTNREVLAETRVSNYALAEDGSTVTYAEDITKKTDYDVISGVDNEVRALPAQGGAPKTLLKSTKAITLTWSRDGRTFAYSKDGKVFVGSVDGGESRQLAGAVGDDTQNTKDTKDTKDSEKQDVEKFSVVRLSAHGERLVMSDKKGLWIVDTKSAAKDLAVPMPEEDKESDRYQVVDWSPDAARVYLTHNSRKQWERGIAKYDVAAKQLTDLIRDAKIYTNVRLSKDGNTFVYNAADGNRPADLYAASSDFRTVKRLTTANPSFANGTGSKTGLISYLDADGKKLYGVLYYPANYVAGTKYPTVFEIYEDFFDDRFSGTINVLTANGYAVMQPSVNLEIGHPGESWVKGVTAAANKLIEMGISDPDRLGVSGTSYGGYATALLITQTTRFKAAIDISGKVDMISFYTDSPRLGVRNTHAPEKSQDRIGGTMWEQQQKYIQHSSVLSADRIKTPLLLMHGEQDHNVPFRQSMEMYYALRRLGKDVKWVAYTHGGHGMPTSTVDEVYDYHRQILGWWDEHLKPAAKKTS